jgi:DNA-binding XRE family transcriptional regulator
MVALQVVRVCLVERGGGTGVDRAPRICTISADVPEPVKPYPPLSSSDHPTPAQLRAARALLGWSQADLSAVSGISPRTLKAMELAPDLVSAPGRPATLLRLLRALAAAGIRFQQGRGVVGVSRQVVRAPSDRE